MAFAGPHDTRNASVEGYITLTPDDYIPYFQKKGVTLIMRLNKKYYDEERFKRCGIDVQDLYYLDGSTPSDAILLRFLKICESNGDGAIGVHCKAGLGRTGTTIGAYCMKHYGFSAAEFIGWNRVVRPGSIIGPQQHYLREIQPAMWEAGRKFRARAEKIRVQQQSMQGPGGSGGGSEGKHDGLEGTSYMDGLNQGVGKMSLDTRDATMGPRVLRGPAGEGEGYGGGDDMLYSSPKGGVGMGDVSQGDRLRGGKATPTSAKGSGRRDEGKSAGESPSRRAAGGGSSSSSRSGGSSSRSGGRRN